MRSAYRVTGAIAILVSVVCLFAVLARLVLPACGVEGVWFVHCDQRISVELGVADEIDHRRLELEARIANLEQSLSSRQCEPVVLARPAVVPVAPDEPEEAEEPEVDEALWNDRNPDVMTGCWDLDRPYRTEDIATHEITSFEQWTICFEGGDGQAGHQVMTSTEGVRCESDIPARFDEQGELVMEETDDLSCSDGSHIFRRIISCDRTAEGGLSCTDFQPQGERSAAFQMSRQ